MAASSRSELENVLLQLLLRGDCDRDFPTVVEELRFIADDASIKAAVLRLKSEGLLQITPDWKLRVAAAAVAGA